MTQAITGRPTVAAEVNPLADVLKSAVSSGQLNVTVPMREGLLHLPAPGRILKLTIEPSTVIKVQGKLVEGPRGPRLADCTLRIEPPLILTNLGEAFGAPPAKGGLWGGLKRAASNIASAAIHPPVAGATIDNDGRLQLEVPGAGDIVMGMIPKSFFPVIQLDVADWFKGSSGPKKAVAQKASGEADVIDAAAAVAEFVQSAVIDAYLAGVAKDGKRSELRLNGSLTQTNDVFEGKVTVNGDLDSTIPVPEQGPTGILGSGVQAAVQGKLTASIDASLGFANGSVSGAARNVVVDMNIIRGSLMGDTVSLALGKDTNVAVRAAAIAVGPQGVTLDKPSVVANLDIGAGHIALEDSAFDIQSGHLEIVPPTDASKIADVNYALTAKANAEGKENVDSAVAELQQKLAARVPQVTVKGSVNVDASLALSS